MSKRRSFIPNYYHNLVVAVAPPPLQHLVDLHFFQTLRINLRIFIMSSMNFSTSKQFVKPPQRGIFPLDHDSDCRIYMEVSVVPSYIFGFEGKVCLILWNHLLPSVYIFIAFYLFFRNI